MCTIGWVRTNSGYILFKNRERKPDENINSNFLNKSNGLVTFEDKIFNGCWFGANKHFGIASAYGPYGLQEFMAQDPADMSIEDENFDINRIVLQKAKSVDEATDLYKKLFLDANIGKSFGVIIGGKNHANILELFKDQIVVEKASNQALRSNSFLLLKGHEGIPDRDDRSTHRLKKVTQLAKTISKVEDVLPILKFHSDNELENVCRHDYGVTVGSIAMESNDDVMIVHHCLNESPCKGEFKKETIKLDG